MGRSINKIGITWVLFCVLSLTANATPIIDTAEFKEDIAEISEAVEEEFNPEIPEPMVYDLVRPLGAKKGELEFNSIIKLNQMDIGHISPEVEYAFADGKAIEIEMPFSQHGVEGIKVALQTTIGTAFDGKYIHGVQNLYNYNVVNQNNTIDNLYIGGYRFNKHISDMMMLGLRLTFNDNDLIVKGLINNALFYERKKFKFGIETNYAYGSGRLGNYFLLMPQLI